MDHGTLTDNNGRKADFRHVIIVMTTNAGAADMARASIGFTQQDNASDGMEAIKRVFSPEFRNRLDAVIQFGGLDARTIERVVDKLLLEMEAQLESKRVTLTLDDAARRWVAEKGYDPKMGARPMARVIQEHIKRPLAEELLFGKLVGGGQVRVGLSTDGSALKLDCIPNEEPALAT
jgi:ATP-dependent Clp protease ATP-binding subunit ClpA